MGQRDRKRRKFKVVPYLLIVIQKSTLVSMSISKVGSINRGLNQVGSIPHGLSPPGLNPPGLNPPGLSPPVTDGSIFNNVSQNLFLPDVGQLR